MKKVRLFAVAAAMGMFASTVTAAETTTAYVGTWGSVDEIIKVDVGDKVVAPTATIKVVKETRTTDSEYDVTSDNLGIESDATCYTSTGVAEDENGDNYSDSQIVVIDNLPGYYNTVEEAVDVLSRQGLFLAPNAEEREEGSYATKYEDNNFADWEEVYAFAEEKGFIESVYDEDGDLESIFLNKIEVTNEKGKVLGTAAVKVTVGTHKYSDEYAMEAVVAGLVGGYPALQAHEGITGTYGNTVTLVETKNYTEDTPLTWNYYATEDAEETTYLKDYASGSVLVVEEDRRSGDLLPIDAGSVNMLNGGTLPQVGQLKDANGNPITLDPEHGKVTVFVKVEPKNGEAYYNKLMTVKQTEAKKWSAEAKLVWDAEAGSFVKEEIGYVAGTTLKGYWWNNEYDNSDDTDTRDFVTADLEFGANVLGLVELDDAYENPSDKYVITGLNPVISGLNTKTERMTLAYTDTKGNEKELTVSAVQLEDDRWYPAVSSEADLVTVVSKIAKIGNFNYNSVTENEDDHEDYADWVELTEALVENPWSGYTVESVLENELQGTGSEACTYVVSTSSEEVEATITSDADSVDTSVAGVKTLTLTAKVGEEVVSTKEVKVVVAPKYERTYVNGKVAVLKAFHLNGNLYAEYHYNWTAKTYEATFYAQDGVTVASTANGTL